ncbi:hypothetical protein OH76DRAFT_4921 [Lentinus brumalis]|uniref:Uncharacterized protein n=1 Tax=Lentinus brumalis TaxID=2498619 RepID=A0A371DWV6_9APHY|nr:hypothetical protein OH76DRAFT_4921 [Polyporus brumalis]
MRMCCLKVRVCQRTCAHYVVLFLSLDRSATCLLADFHRRRIRITTERRMLALGATSLSLPPPSGQVTSRSPLPSAASSEGSYLALKTPAHYLLLIRKKSCDRRNAICSDGLSLQCENAACGRHVRDRHIAAL